MVVESPRYTVLKIDRNFAGAEATKRRIRPYSSTPIRTREVTHVGRLQLDGWNYCVEGQPTHTSGSEAEASLRGSRHDEAWIEPSGELFV